MTRRRNLTALSLVAAAICASVLPVTGAAADNDPQSFRTVWDDFRNGFTTTGPNARWSLSPVGSFVPNDAITTTSREGLRVVSSGVNPSTGQPAFVLTLGQDKDNGGLSGELDHAKWVVFANHQASSGFPGFDAAPGHVLSCETWISGRTYGTSAQPFGQNVANPNDDPRLAAVAMNVADTESSMVFDFFMTNERIYALYERGPFGRPVLGNYAAFSFMIPVAKRSAEHQEHLTISYDRDAGVVRWMVDGKEVYRVDHLGFRIDRKYMVLDNGGVEMPARPRQLDCGMGMFTLLDGSAPGGPDFGLVRLSSADPFYFDPARGEPVPQTFLDDESLESNRLFGQGASMAMARYVVSSVPANHG